ncbi:MAG TPA: phosphatase PAP2 family protein [Solirubrobacteraceae bacterium]
MSARAYTAATAPRSRGHSDTREPRDSLAAPLLVAVLCALGLALVWIVATHVGVARRFDARLLERLTSFEGPRVNSVGQTLLHLLNPTQFTIWAVVLVLFALARNRPRVALAVALIMALAPLSAEALKPLLAYPHLSYGEFRTIGAASWPSGHATAVTVLVCSVVLVCPPRWRLPAIVLGAGFALTIGVTLIVLAWHMPSDVLGGYLLGTLWAALAVAGVRASESRWPSRHQRH